MQPTQFIPTGNDNEADWYIRPYANSIPQSQSGPQQPPYISYQAHQVPPQGGGSDMTTPTREEIDAKLLATERRMEASEARIDAALERVVSQVDAMRVEVKHLPSTWTLITSIATVVTASTGLIVGILAFGGDRFDAGVQVSTGFAESTIETRQIAKQNAEQIKALTERSQKNDAQLDAIFERLVGSSGEKNE